MRRHDGGPATWAHAAASASTIPVGGSVTVTYAIWNGVAYAPYSVDIPIEVTP